MSSLSKRSIATGLLIAVVAAGASATVTAAAVSDNDSDSESGSTIEYLNADPATTSPYSDAVAVGSTLHLAGNLGLDANGKIVPGGIKAETTQMMANLKQALERNRSSLDRVVNCEAMLATPGADTVAQFITARDAFNEVYSTYWKQGRFPARHAFGVTGLYLGALVEIACDAVRA